MDVLHRVSSSFSKQQAIIKKITYLQMTFSLLLIKRLMAECEDGTLNNQFNAPFSQT